MKDINKQIQLRNEFLDALKEHLQLAQQRMKIYVDGQRRDLEFQLGELVLLKFKP